MEWVIDKLKLIIPACDDYLLGLSHEKAGRLAEAFSAYSRSYENGYKKAATNLATFYREDRRVAGVNVDFNKAYFLLLVAAEDGHARAMINLALMHIQSKVPDAVYESKQEVNNKDTRLKYANIWAEAAKLKGDPRGVGLVQQSLAKSP